jgi:anaerobic ribonucleoside-triphosphate reductase
MGRYNSGDDVCDECGITFGGSESGLCYECHVKDGGDYLDWQEEDDDDRLPPHEVE